MEKKIKKTKGLLKNSRKRDQFCPLYFIYSLLAQGFS